MARSTLHGRRSIEPRSARAARAAGWRLVFDKPALVPMGHSYANIVVDPTANVWGVLYEITADDLEHIELTEGVRIDNYRAVELHGESATGPPLLRAVSLTSDRRDASLRPTTRYMSLLVEGAEEHGLPPEYVAWLRSITAEPESAAAAAWRAIVDPALRRR